MMVDTSSMLISMGLNPKSVYVYNRYDLLRQLVESAIKAYCKWGIEQATTTQYFDGNGSRDLVLRQPYVSAVASVYLDQTAAYGQATNAFAAGTLLTEGVDYALVLDDGNVGRSGLLRKLNYPNGYLMFPSAIIYGQGSSGLAYSNPPWWPAGYGNVKATYTYGFTVATMPNDLKLAVSVGVGIAANSSRYGYSLTSENLGAHSVSMTQDRAFAGVWQLLSLYRDTSVGAGIA